MTFSRSLVLGAMLGLFTFASGCTADAMPADDTGESADELNGGLRNITVVKGSLTAEGTITVHYEPDLYASIRRPFLAVEILPPVTETPAEQAGTLSPLNGRMDVPLSVDVAGEFPGAPRVLVTDENFNVIAGTRARTTESGAEASLDIVTNRGKKFVLVRDMLWVTPMSFEVTVGR